VGSPKLWGFGFAATSGVAFAVLTTIFDSARLGSWSSDWAAIAVITYCQNLLLAWLAWNLFLKKALNKKPRAWINILTCSVIAALHNLAVTVLAMQAQLDPLPLWPLRILGGVLLGGGFVIAYALTFGTRAEHKQLLGELASTRARLDALRSQSESRLQSEHDELHRETNKALLPKLTLLQKALSGENPRAKSIDLLTTLVSSDVRTLANDLQQKAGELHTTIEPIEAVISYKALRQSSVKVLPLCRPLVTYWPIALVTWVIGFEVFGSAEVAGLLLAVSLSCLGLFFLFKLAVPAGLSLPWWIMRLLSILVGGVAVLPTFLVALSLSRTTFQTLSAYTLLVSGAFITLVSMASTVLEASRVQSVRSLQRANTRLKREVTLFEQRLWLERRSWQFAVHGSVQASLTAALTRLRDESIESGTAIRQVQLDVTRALCSIESVSTQGVDISKALVEIRDTWTGIASIDVNVSPDVTKALSTSDSAAVCVNEVCKEAVNNAIKHGEATQIDLLVDMPDQHTVRIIAVNNGKPLKAKLSPSVGSALLDELTLTWHLNALKRGGKTKFEALVPLASR